MPGGNARNANVSALVALAVILMASASGCNSDGRIGVGGRVTRDDGSPVVGARVIFRDPKTGHTASGITDQEGRYELGSGKVGEGILPGGYFVLVQEDRGDWDSLKPPTIHPKYARPSDSGLAFKVEPGGETTYDIVVEPAPGA